MITLPEVDGVLHVADGAMLLMESWVYQGSNTPGERSETAQKAIIDTDPKCPITTLEEQEKDNENMEKHLYSDRRTIMMFVVVVVSAAAAAVVGVVVVVVVLLLLLLLLLHG